MNPELSLSMVPVLLDIMLIAGLMIGIAFGRISRLWRLGLAGLIAAMMLHLAESVLATPPLQAASDMLPPIVRTLSVLALFGVAWFLREAAGTQLRLSEWANRHQEHLEGSLEDAPLIVVNLREDGTIVGVNRFGSHLLQPEGDLTDTDFFACLVAPADRESARAGFASFVDSGGVWPGFAEYAILTPSGPRTIRWTRNALYSESGRVESVVSYGEDVTELKHAERSLERYRALSEHARDIIMFVRASDGRILEANAAAEQAYGYSRRELLTLTVHDMRAPDSRGTVDDQISQAASGGITFQTTHVRSNGSPFPVEVNAQAIGTENDETVLLSVVRDVTERNRRERELAEYRARLSDLARRLDETQASERRRLASEIHDRVSQPLAAAKLRLNLMMRRRPELREAPELEESLDLLSEAIRESRAITSEMSPPLLYDVGLNAALDWLATEELRRYGLECTVDATADDIKDEEVKTFVFKAARELLMNAAKHSGATRAHVGLRSVGDDLELVVRDEGRGFDTEMLKRPSGDSRGFGLFNLAESASHLHALVDVRSHEGQGTTVTVRVAHTDPARASTPAPRGET